MSRNLYIIVRSLNPNSYLNSIVHCILNENVKRVVFVAVKRPGDSQIPLARIAASVAALLEQLAQGKYTYIERETNSLASVDLVHEYDHETFSIIVAKYTSCFRILGENLRNEIKTIPYEELRAELSMIRRTEDAMFDITSTANYLVSDIASICMVEGISSMYTFESFVEPLYGKDGWKTLIHHLDLDCRSTKQTYQYINLLNTLIYKECVRSLFGKNAAHIKELNDELIEAHQARLRLLELRAAREGAETPPQVAMEIQTIQRAIKGLQQQANNPM